MRSALPILASLFIAAPAQANPLPALPSAGSLLTAPGTGPSALPNVAAPHLLGPDLASPSLSAPSLSNTGTLPGLDAMESGAIEIGVADGNNDAHGSLLGASVLGSGDSGGSSQGLGVGVLNDGELLHLELAGGSLLAVPLAHGLGTTVHDLARSLTLPLGHALPNLSLLPGISLLGGTDTGIANPVLNLGVFVGDNGGSGGAIGLAVLSGRNTSEASLLGVGILNQGEGGSNASNFDWGSLAVLDGNGSGQGEWLGVSVLGGHNSGTAERGLGLGLLNEGEILHLDLAGERYLLIPALPAPLDGLGNDLHATLRAWLVPVGAFLPALNALDGLSLLGGETGENNPLLNLGALAGDGAGSGGVIGLAVLSGNDSASGQSLGIGVLNGDNGSRANGGHGNGSSDSGLINPNGSWIAVGALDGNNSGNAQWVAIGALSGSGSGQAHNGLGVGALNSDETLRIDLGGENLAFVPALPSPVGSAGTETGKSLNNTLMPIGDALPGLAVMPGIEVLGGESPDGANPLANTGVLVGDGGGSGGLIGVGAIAGDNAGQGNIVSISAISGDHRAQTAGSRAGTVEGNGAGSDGTGAGNGGTTGSDGSGGNGQGDAGGGFGNGNVAGNGGSGSNGGAGSGNGSSSNGGSNGSDSAGNGGNSNSGSDVASNSGTGSSGGSASGSNGQGSSGNSGSNNGSNGSDSAGDGSNSNSGTDVASNSGNGGNSGSANGGNGQGSSNNGAGGSQGGNAGSEGNGNSAPGSNAQAAGGDGSTDVAQASQRPDNAGCQLPNRERSNPRRQAQDNEREPRCEELQRTEGV